ncbi:hypothetical protein HELRODRAFT_189237 [Helobdella robusta]|uniref:Uncharacterized protein n=1 Tax=Helobdella robusta TaxID=6412 RepID=T1FQU6_HELRO|nr:hypothetical protein HELRODRAFT_189237 [Helobdella robusta]ESN96435.1 hypothetical protein HELRODRAFT_189237 [Helobdella robusta]
MAQQHCLFVLGSLTLTFATIAVGVSFFAPYWLYNVHRPADGHATIEQNLDVTQSYIVYPGPTNFKYRGLWAQCYDTCQWFWQNNFKLEQEKFIPLGWHVAVQVLYFLGAFLVFFCEIISRLQLCCRTRMCVYRLLGFILLFSFVVQAAAVAVFGGFANKDYGASPLEATTTHLGWAFWMTLAGGGLTLLSGVYFLFLDCCNYIDDEEFLK